MQEVVNLFSAQDVRKAGERVNSQMNSAATEARNAYKRKWAKEHPESIRRSQEKYWTKKAMEMQQAAKKAADPDAGK